ncbi:MAG: hypothetical protein R3E08_06920, partial [Thiotrichaceae bacterium]
MLNNIMKLLKFSVLMCSFIWASFIHAADETCNAERIHQMLVAQSYIYYTVDLTAANTYEQLPNNALPVHEGVLHGTPLQEHIITALSLNSYQDSYDFESILIPKTTWYIPLFLTNLHRTTSTRVYCWQGKLRFMEASNRIDEKLMRLLTSGIDLTQAKLVYTTHEIGLSTHSFVAVPNNGETVIYPILTRPGQYDNLKTVDSFGGYQSADVVLNLLLDYLIMTNRRVVISFMSPDTPNFNIHIPRADYFPTQTDVEMQISAPIGLELDLTFIPN